MMFFPFALYWVRNSPCQMFIYIFLTPIVPRLQLTAITEVVDNNLIFWVGASYKHLWSKLCALSEADLVPETHKSRSLGLYEEILPRHAKTQVKMTLHHPVDHANCHQSR